MKVLLTNEIFFTKKMLNPDHKNSNKIGLNFHNGASWRYAQGRLRYEPHFRRKINLFLSSAGFRVLLVTPEFKNLEILVVK